MSGAAVLLNPRLLVRCLGFRAPGALRHYWLLVLSVVCFSGIIITIVILCVNHFRDYFGQKKTRTQRVVISRLARFSMS